MALSTYNELKTSIGDWLNRSDLTSVIPDFIANCGMARVFGYLMGKEVKIDDYEIFKDVSLTIEKALVRIQQFNQKPVGISGKGLEMSLAELLR